MTVRAADLHRHKLSCSERQRLGMKPPVDGYKIPKHAKRSNQLQKAQPSLPETESHPAPVAVPVEDQSIPVPEMDFDINIGDELLNNFVDNFQVDDSATDASDNASLALDDDFFNCNNSENIEQTFMPPKTPLSVTFDPQTSSASRQSVKLGPSPRHTAPSSTAPFPAATMTPMSSAPASKPNSTTTSHTSSVPDTDLDFMDVDSTPRSSAIGKTCQATLKLARLLGEDRKRTVTVDLETRKHGIVIVKTLESCKFPDGTSVKYAAEKIYHPPASDYFEELGFN